MRHSTLLALSLGLVAAIAASSCGDPATVGSSQPSGTAATTTPAPTTTAAPAPFVALRYVTTGGCEVLGPNCPTYVVWSDGRVEVFRTGSDDAVAELTGTVPVAHVTAWLAAVADLDVARLAAEVGPGTCNSCVDGADIVATAATATGPVTLDSTKLAFDQSNDVFAAMEVLVTDIVALGQLPVIERT